VAILLAFPGKQGVEGLYAGLCLGPAIQVNLSLWVWCQTPSATHDPLCAMRGLMLIRKCRL